LNNWVLDLLYLLHDPFNFVFQGFIVLILTSHNVCKNGFGFSELRHSVFIFGCCLLFCWLLQQVDNKKLMYLLAFLIEIIFYYRLVKILRLILSILGFKLFFLHGLCHQMFVDAHTKYAVEKWEGLRRVSSLFAL